MFKLDKKTLNSIYCTYAAKMKIEIKECLKEEYVSLSNSYNTVGTYCPDYNLICIKKNFPNYIKIAIFFHELGHVNCWIKKCNCTKHHNGKYIDPVKCELHANTFCIEKLVEHNLIDSLNWYFNLMKNFAKEKNIQDPYRLAAIETFKKKKIKMVDKQFGITKKRR